MAVRLVLSPETEQDIRGAYALFDVICRGHGKAEVVETPKHINDPEFAGTAASRLLQLMGE